MRWDAVLHPVGPLPVVTYWLRRAAVLGGIIVVLIVLGVIVGASGGSKAHTKTTGAGVDIPTAGLSSPRSSPSTSPIVTKPAACADADLAVSITTGATRYPSSSLPQFIVTVTNTGVTACTRDVGPKATVITVLSGADRIWSSGDCPSVTAGVRTLSPGVAVKLASSWDRDRSVPGCTTTGAAGLPAKAGSYVASVKLGTLAAPGTATFHLS